MELETYSEKSFVVKGDTRPYKDQLSSLLGSYNKNLKDGPGWIFSNKHKEKVSKFLEEVKNGKSKPATNLSQLNVSLQLNVSNAKSLFTPVFSEISLKLKKLNNNEKVYILSNILELFNKSLYESYEDTTVDTNGKDTVEPKSSSSDRGVNFTKNSDSESEDEIPKSFVKPLLRNQLVVEPIEKPKFKGKPEPPRVKNVVRGLPEEEASSESEDSEEEDKPVKKTKKTK